MPGRRTRFALLLAGTLLSLSAASAGAAITIPWIGQKSAADCGRAVLAALAARRGGNAEAAYAKLPDPPDPVNGYSISDMRRFGARVGVGLSLRAPGGIVIAGDCAPRPAVAGPDGGRRTSGRRAGLQRLCLRALSDPGQRRRWQLHRA